MALCLGLLGRASAQWRDASVSSLSPHLPEVRDLGRAPGAEELSIVVGLGLRNRDALEAHLTELQDPASPIHHRFLTQDEFNASYAPTPAEEEAVVAHLAAHGLRVTERAPNRLVVAATGSVAAIERAFGVEMHAVGFRGARHHAAINEPSFPPGLASVVVGVIGLDDLEERRALHPPPVGASAPKASLGANCCAFSPNDVATFYHDSAGFDGTGQTLVIAGAYAWQDTDNTGFNTQWGLPQLPAGSGQVCTGAGNPAGCRFDSQQSIEIALDVEYAHGVAPGARILNYMAASTANGDFTTMYNRIVTDNPGHVVSTSWGSCEASLTAAEQQADDNIFANANAIGQSWFAASGDNGSRDCGTSVVTVDNPANSPHVIGVGGTAAVCSGGMQVSNPACAGYGSETAWSSSGGGESQVFLRPAFQHGCGVPSRTGRLVPDVALESAISPGNYVRSGGKWFIVGGTSDAAPQWAGYFVELIQKNGGAGLGNPGALLYALCGTPAYHDITSGSNGDYSAAAGYDMVTGVGTIESSEFLARASTGTTITSTTTSPSPTTSTTLPGCAAAPRSGCQLAFTQKAQLLVGPTAGGRLSWKWTSSTSVVTTDFGDPPASTDYVLCLYDPSGLRSGGRAPASGTCGTRPCWRTLSTGFKYADNDGTPDGLTRMLLRAGGPGRAKSAVTGKGANLHVPPLPLGTPVTVQLVRGDTGACWEATYSVPTRNDATGFKARSD